MFKKTLTALAIALSASLLAVATRNSGLIKRMEYPSWDMRVRARAKPSAFTSTIKLIMLDQDSLDWGKETMGLSWPWPREVYAPIIQFVRRGGARAVAFDVLFLEPSAYGVQDDESLGQAMQAGHDVVAAAFLGNDTGALTSWPDNMAGVRAWLPGAPADSLASVPAPLRRLRLSAPISQVATNAFLVANVNDAADVDGVFRRAQLLCYLGAEPVVSLGAALRLVDAPVGAPGVASLFAPARDGVISHFRATPVDKDYRAILNFRGPSQTHETFNAAAVINSELAIQGGVDAPQIDPAVFTNAFVLFGFSAPGLMDLRSSPVSKVYPGVEIHATVLDNLLAEDFIRDTAGTTLLCGCLALAFVCALLMRLCRRAWQSVVLFVVALPLPALTGLLLYELDCWWPVVPHTLAVVIALVGGIVVNYATEGRQKAFIKQAFKHYLSPDVIERIIRDPSSLELGGERRELTIFFSDLQGFSSISERLDPVPLTKLLNDYLTEMTDIIHDEGGTLDKYEGDAIIAFWNAPLDQPDHAERGCRAAVRCQRRLTELRGRYKQDYDVELHMRIGLNTGPVVVGNMGSRDRFDYTVLGDAANLASRLEGANKLFRSWIMVSEDSWVKAGPHVGGRLLGALRVVGRSKPVNVYELAGTSAADSPAYAEGFAQGLSALKLENVQAALDAFSACGDDSAARVYAERCRAVLAAGKTWDGIWNLTEK